MKAFCNRLLCAIGAFTLLATGKAVAEVTAVSANGFTSTHTHTLPLPPQEAWTLLTDGLNRWWDASHSYSTVAGNLSLVIGADGNKGGCLCERLDEGGWVEHLRVIFVQPGETLRLQGALGPLVDMGMQGVMRWTLEPAEGDPESTMFTSRYVVTGHLEGGFEQLAPVVDQVNGGHFIRLERVARGLPAAD
jgi:uncharacterized protein YndB with AHSA1/START domain